MAEFDAGRLDKLVTIQRPAAGQDSIGQPLTSSEVVAEVWANIRYGSGSEAIRNGLVTSRARVSIRIRFRDDVASDMQIVRGSTQYNILAALPDETEQWLDLVCEVLS